MKASDPRSARRLTSFLPHHLHALDDSEWFEGLGQHFRLQHPVKRLLLMPKHFKATLETTTLRCGFADYQSCARVVRSYRMSLVQDGPERPRRLVHHRLQRLLLRKTSQRTPIIIADIPNPAVPTHLPPSTRTAFLAIWHIKYDSRRIHKVAGESNPSSSH